MENHNPYQTPEAEVETTPQEFQSPVVFALNGRIGRIRYFAYSILYSFIAMFFAMLGVLLIGDGLGEAMTSVLMMVFLIPAYVVAMKRRLNDLGRTGWFSLIGLIPFVGGILGLYLLLAKGETHANEYGLPPEKGGKGPLLVVVVFVSIMLIGIGAAILVPMYADQANRANVTEMNK